MPRWKQDTVVVCWGLALVVRALTFHQCGPVLHPNPKENCFCGGFYMVLQIYSRHSSHPPPSSQWEHIVCLSFFRGVETQGPFSLPFLQHFSQQSFEIRISDVNGLCWYAMLLETVVKERPEETGTLTCGCNADCIVCAVLYQLSYQAN